MSRNSLRLLPGGRRPTRTASRLVRKNYAHLRRTLRELEQDGSIEARPRLDKRMGYWPLEKGRRESERRASEATA